MSSEPCTGGNCRTSGRVRQRELSPEDREALEPKPKVVEKWLGEGGFALLLNLKDKKGSAEVGGLGYGYQDFLVLQIVAITFFAIFVPVAGRLADRFGRRPMLIVVTIAIMIFGLTFRYWLSAESMGTGEDLNVWQMLAFLAVGMTLMGLTFGPMSAVLPELFPTNTRYTGSGVAYNAASILGAALTPFVAAWLVQASGVGAVGLYLAGLGVLTLIALILAPETSKKSLYTEAAK